MLGNFLALLGALTVTGYLIIGRKLRAKISLIPYIFMVYGFAAVTLIIIMFASGNSPFGYAPKTYGWIFLLAALPQLIGHSTYNWALKYMPATFVAVTTLGEPIGSAILAFFILSETPTFATMIGGVFILIGYLSRISTIEIRDTHEFDHPRFNCLHHNHHHICDLRRRRRLDDAGCP